MLSKWLANTCSSIALSFDAWTSSQGIPILGVIGHWLTPQFEEREALLEFAEIDGEHSGENIALMVEELLFELDIANKIIALTGDNAGNNGTYCDHLHKSLLQTYDDADVPPRLRLNPLMRFRGRKSYIPCLAHVINLICDDVLKTLKAGNAKDARDLLDKMASSKQDVFSQDNARGAIAKVRILMLWVLRHAQRQQDWAKVSPTKKVQYDVETWWNSTHDMIQAFLKLRKE